MVFNRKNVVIIKIVEKILTKELSILKWNLALGLLKFN